jgi:hypothetical protein
MQMIRRLSRASSEVREVVPEKTASRSRRLSCAHRGAKYRLAMFGTGGIIAKLEQEIQNVPGAPKEGHRLVGRVWAQMFTNRMVKIARNFNRRGGY